VTGAASDRAPVPTPPSGGRLEYLDWLRGLAVVIMIEAHLLDSWTAQADRKSLAYGIAMMVGGMGAPLFLFLAGVSVSLAAGSRAKRVGSAGAAASVRARGWQVLGFAFLFRLYSWALSPGATLRGLLKVDILNVMGPSIVFAAWLWQVGRTTLGRAASLTAATVVLAMVTPIVRATPWLDFLPDPLETYIRPGKGLSTFALFPWAAFVTAGAVCGLAIHAAGRSGGRKVAAGCAAAGVALWAFGYGLSFRPSIYAPSQSHFWTTSPTFLSLRVGLLALAVALAWAWGRRPWPRLAWSPLEVLGASSLFVYWIHVEMVYGVIATPLKRALSFPQAVLAFALFTGLMLLLTVAKLRVVARWQAGEGQAAPAGSKG
jgi:uncharacterized membrane protein